MIARIIEGVAEIRKGEYAIRSGVRLVAQNRDDRELLDKIRKFGVEVDKAGGRELDLRLCK